ncbi:MAG: hypothetical protein LBQ23_02330 [Puniceicoccales bacterium]|jgi:hypothetical protein|nr:hypothetical protein [Puniceicoccales bacterium]
MKRKVVILIFLNAIIFALIGYWFHSKTNVRVVGAAIPKLQSIDKITIRNLGSNRKIFLRKSPKTGAWETVWDDNIWPANLFAIERFYETLETHLDKKLPDEIPPKCCYEVTVSSEKSLRKVQFTSEDFNFIFSNLGFDPNKLQAPDDTILVKFLDPKIFPHVGNDCKIFKIKSQKWEFVFAKRQGKWFLEHSDLHFEIKDELILKFFHEIFSLESKDIAFSYDNIPEHTLSISLYGENLIERVSFMDMDEQTCFAENDAIDLFFIIEHGQFAKIVDAIGNLLKVNIFSTSNCNDISVSTSNNGEYFNFHNLNNQNKWQFTYSQSGDLKIKEISQEDMDEMLAVFANTPSMIVSPSLLFEDKAFTVTLNEFSDNPRVFNFYRKDGQLFVGTNNQDIKFEIASCFEAILFHNIRRHTRESEDLLL